MDVGDINANGFEGLMISTAPRLAEMYTPPISNICISGTMVLAVTAKEFAALMRT